MSRSGRLVADQARDAAARPCSCTHTLAQHHERGYGNPGHVALVFFCDECPCSVDLRATPVA